MSTNIIFAGMPNHADGGTITNGSEVASLPGTNLQDRQIRKVWRTDGTVAAADTYIVINYGLAKLTGVVSLINHNVGNQGKWRIRVSNESDFSTTLYDSGLIDMQPTIESFGALPWGEFHWAGKLSSAELGGITINSFHVLDSQILARYVRIDIVDEDNSDGYIEVGRLIAGAAYIPTKNIQYNWSISYEDPSPVSKSIGGQTYVDELERYRVLRFLLSDLPEDEIFTNFFDILDRRKGIAGDLLVIPQPDKLTQLWNQAIYGRLRVLDPVINPYYGAFEKGFEIEELL